MTVPDEAIRRRLTHEALRLQHGQRTPIDVRRLLDSLGIRLTLLVEGDRSSHGSLVWRGTYVEVILRREKPRSYLSSRERFTIAHELGHFFLEARFGYRPGSEAEYWQIESLCNEFAGRLLLPEVEMQRALIPRPNTSARLLQCVQRLAQRQLVSFQVAGTEVVIYVPNASVGELVEHNESGSLAKLRWKSEGQQFVGVGPGSYIMPDDPLANVIRDHASTHDGQARESRVNGVVVASVRSGPTIRIASLIPS